MKIFLCIDDTDVIGSRGTGELAELIKENIENNQWGKTQSVTRHQLLVHEDIPYTSHNSCMCFTAEVNEQYIDDIINFSSAFLEKESEKGSDPGLCIAVIDNITGIEKLKKFGRRAKKEVLTKEEAYKTAKELGIHLSEHGGTGQGIIGALAGVGLRMTGNDGRFKGNFKLECDSNVVKAAYLLEKFNIDSIQSIKGQAIENDEYIFVSDKIKTVLLNNKSVFLVTPSDDEKQQAAWKSCSKSDLKKY